MSDPLRINQLQGAQPNPSTPSIQSKANSTGTSFSEILDQVQGGLKFSNHAQKRLEYRQINLTDDGLQRLAQAVDKAEKKGGKESLVLVDDLAFIVNIKERTVITALDSQSRGQGVFTQIDSVVFADPSDSKTKSA